jgi:hypothetical protein
MKKTEQISSILTAEVGVAKSQKQFNEVARGF